jgi:hypothetical protein
MKRIFKKLIKAYYRLFYFFFKIEKKDGREGEETDSFAAIAALIPMVVLCFTTFLTLLYVIARFVLPFSPPSVIFFIIVVIIDIGLNGWLFLHKKHYLQIKAMFQGENEDLRIKRTFWCILFSLQSLFTMALLIAEFGLPWAK